MRIVVFKHASDLLELRSLLYGSPDDQRRGMAKAKAYQIRGPLPPSVHLTCQLLAAIHADLPNVDLYAIRLTYSMALIRFVNEILDTAQQGRSVVPLHALAQMADLPASFVELRHAATHEDLPSIYLLRDLANRAVSWLWAKYWSLQTNEAAPSPRGSYAGGIKELLREWRRLKRGDPRTTPPIELITSLQTQWSRNNREFLDVVLTQNVLVPGQAQVSSSSVVALYLPIFESLGPEFCSKLVAEVVNVLLAREWPLVATDPREKRQYPMFQAWAEALAQYLDMETLENVSTSARPWNALVLAKYALAKGDRDLWETAEEMGEFTGVNIPLWEQGWKKVSNWVPRPLGQY